MFFLGGKANVVGRMVACISAVDPRLSARLVTCTCWVGEDPAEEDGRHTWSCSIPAIQRYITGPVIISSLDHLSYLCSATSTKSANVFPLK